ncbi:MAG: hypothetical protein AAFY78_22390 [Cyanobacteria bacterium J06648_16]
MIIISYIDAFNVCLKTDILMSVNGLNGSTSATSATLRPQTVVMQFPLPIDAPTPLVSIEAPFGNLSESSAFATAVTHHLQ